jgi:hypothetical protein
MMTMMMIIRDSSTIVMGINEARLDRLDIKCGRGLLFINNNDKNKPTRLELVTKSRVT